MAQAAEGDTPAKDAVATPEQEDADFEAGYNGAPTEETPPAAGSAGEDGEGASTASPPAEKVAEPEYVQITKAELDQLKALSTQIEQIRADSRKAADTANGRYGELARTLQQIRAAAPAGGKVEVTDEIVADIKAEFPELSAAALSAFKKFAEKLPGTGTAPAFDPSQVQTMVAESEQRVERKLLTALHRDWETVIGLRDENGNVPDTEYRRWIQTQPEEYRNKVLSSWDAVTVADSIDAFKAAAKAAAEKAATEKAAAEKAAAEKANGTKTTQQATRSTTRQRTLAAAAATPRGEGSAPPAATDDDQFEAGYASG